MQPQVSGTIIAVLLLFSGTALTSCGQPATPINETIQSNSVRGSLSEVVLEVPTSFCTGCWPRIEASAKSVPGVSEVRFDEEQIQRVTVIYDPSQTTPEAIIHAIEKGGDKVSGVIEGDKS